MIKDYGYNGVDWYPIASQEALEAADEIGIVIQLGAAYDARRYLMSASASKIKGNLREVPLILWAYIAKWTRNYPSMSIYLLGGETCHNMIVS